MINKLSTSGTHRFGVCPRCGQATETFAAEFDFSGECCHQCIDKYGHMQSVQATPVFCTVTVQHGWWSGRTAALLISQSAALKTAEQARLSGRRYRRITLTAPAAIAKIMPMGTLKKLMMINNKFSGGASDKAL